MLGCMSVFFLFKQKTAYEMRISDGSSDVCSADLGVRGVARAGLTGVLLPMGRVGGETHHRHQFADDELLSTPMCRHPPAQPSAPSPARRARPDRKSVV